MLSEVFVVFLRTKRFDLRAILCRKAQEVTWEDLKVTLGAQRRGFAAQ